jgi:hypothetical protein
MTEPMNVEVAHKLTERERTAGEKGRWEEIFEIVEVLVLALAAIATAWSGYQATKGEAKQSILYAEATKHRFQAEANASAGQARLAADAALFTSWLQATRANDTQLQKILVRRFSTEYQKAFAAWLNTAPFTNPKAPPGPGYMPQYHNPQVEQAKHLNEQAATADEEGTHAREAADKYVRETVLFALVLFLIAVGQRFRVHGVRIAVITVGLGMFAFASYNVLALPRF